MDSKNQQLYRSILFTLVFILGTLASQVASRSLQEESMYERHEQWMTSFGRVYKDAAEKEERFKIFKANVEMIESFNKASNKPYKLGVNQFADLTNEEFKLRNRFKSHECSSTTPFKYENVSAVPATMDWRKKGAVTPQARVVLGPLVLNYALHLPPHHFYQECLLYFHFPEDVVEPEDVASSVAAAKSSGGRRAEATATATHTCGGQD